MDRQSQFIQGYRLFYRPSGGSWLLHDINSPSERSALLAHLLKGTEYELKIRPYFDEFQGKDSRTLLVRTPEEGTEFGTSGPLTRSKEIKFSPNLIKLCSTALLPADLSLACLTPCESQQCYLIFGVNFIFSTILAG